MAKVEYNAVGRRKTAIARVRLVAGDGKIVINKRDLDEYFGLETLKMTVRQPLELTKAGGDMDILVNVRGGGLSGQAGAIRHGISRALIKANPDLRESLKKAGFLTRDPRMKERKKYGLKAARRAPQFSMVKDNGFVLFFVSLQWEILSLVRRCAEARFPCGSALRTLPSPKFP